MYFVGRWILCRVVLSYHGGQLFGNSVSDNNQLAKTVLDFMMLPISKLDTDFLYDQSKMFIDQIKDRGGKWVAITCDNNRVNQAFFKRFSCTSPWRTEDNVFLLFYFVHIVKIMRNNWITEKTGKLEFNYQGENYVAKWDKIRKL